MRAREPGQHALRREQEEGRALAGGEAVADADGLHAAVAVEGGEQVGIEVTVEAADQHIRRFGVVRAGEGVGEGREGAGAAAVGDHAAVEREPDPALGGEVGEQGARVEGGQRGVRFGDGEQQRDRWRIGERGDGLLQGAGRQAQQAAVQRGAPGEATAQRRERVVGQHRDDHGIAVVVPQAALAATAEARAHGRGDGRGALAEGRRQADAVDPHSGRVHRLLS